MELLTDVDVSLTINLTANISNEVSEDCSAVANHPHRNKRTRQFKNKGRKV